MMEHADQRGNGEAGESELLRAVAGAAPTLLAPLRDKSFPPLKGRENLRITAV